MIIFLITIVVILLLNYKKIVSVDTKNNDSLLKKYSFLINKLKQGSNNYRTRNENHTVDIFKVENGIYEEFKFMEFLYDIEITWTVINEKEQTNSLEWKFSQSENQELMYREISKSISNQNKSN